MSILYIRDKNGNFVQMPSVPGKSAYEIAVAKGTFSGTEQEFAEMQVINNKDIIDQITQENIDNWNSAKGITDEEKEQLNTKLATKFDDVALNENETNDMQTVLDFYSEGKVVKTAYFTGGSGGDLSDYAKVEDIPTKTSQLTNDSNFITSIPSDYVTESELTAKDYATKNYVTTAIDNAQLGGGDVDLSDYAKVEDIPTKTSDLTNDSNFITSIPSDYVTESELDSKISDYAKESDTVTSIAVNGSVYTNDNRIITLPDYPNEYTLPAASATTLGGIKVGAGLNIEDGVLSVEDNTSSSSNNVLYLSPQQFGAVGDGITDDLNAFISMFNYMIENASDIDVGETSVKDFGKYEILFTGKYAISDTIELSSCYNFKIDRLNLVATNTFNGEYLIKLTGITRNINFSNCIFDGNEYKASCLLIDEGCSDLNIKFTDCNFRRFKAYGLKNIGTGHEMLINNCKISQYDWGSEGYPSGAIGLYIGAESHDHQIINTIICYCSENLFINYGGSCFVNSVHFYGLKVSIIGGYTFFNNCYFDSTCLEINGFNSVKNCFFLSGEENYFIKLTDTAENSWTYSLTDIIGNRFNANTSSITTPIVSDNIDISTLSMNIYDNIFYNVTPICSKSEHVYNPSPYPTIWSGTQAEYDSIEWKDDYTLYLIRGE